MKKVLRTNKDGSSYYSFLCYDKKTSKWVRMPKEYIFQRFGRHITTEDDAAQVVKILNAEYESMRMRLAKRASWEKEFYSFGAILESYAKAQKKRAPNSYKNNVHYLKHYVLHYFLNIQRCNNVDFWPDHYGAFRDWLETRAYLIKQPDKIISYGAKNHCIKALNTLMRQLYQERVVQRLSLCEKFPSHKLNERTIDEVISEHEMERIYAELKRGDGKLEAVFFRMLYFTGLRFNEALGLSLADLHKGLVQHDSLKVLLDKYGIEYNGYLVLASQPDHATKALRGKDGRIHRKPLKGKKKISEKHSRVIVITDQQVWIELVDLYNAQVEKMEKGTYGGLPADYALFDGLDRSTAARRLHEAYSKTGLRYRSWHCCRHSCATNIIGSTGDYTLARLWLGHSSPSVIERYVHVHQAIVRMAIQQGDQGGRKVRKIDL